MTANKRVRVPPPGPKQRNMSIESPIYCELLTEEGPLEGAVLVHVQTVSGYRYVFIHDKHHVPYIELMRPGQLAKFIHESGQTVGPFGRDWTEEQFRAWVEPHRLHYLIRYGKTIDQMIDIFHSGDWNVEFLVK